MQSIAEQEVTNAALLRIMCFFLTSDIVGLAVRLMRLSAMIRNYVLSIKRKHLLISLVESTRAMSFNEYHLFHRLA